MFLAEIEKHATFLSVIVLKFISSISSSSVRAPSRSFLFPSISKGIPIKVGLETSECNYFLASSILLISTASTTNIIASAFLQYFSQLSLNLAYPPKSQTFSPTFPFLISFKLKPIVGIVSSSY